MKLIQTLKEIIKNKYKQLIIWIVLGLVVLSILLIPLWAYIAGQHDTNTLILLGTPAYLFAVVLAIQPIYVIKRR